MDSSWTSYAENAFGHDLTSAMWATALAQWQSMNETVFSDMETDVMISDISKVSYEDASGLESALSADPASDVRIRIITIHSRNTVEKLSISASTMCSILHKYNVHPDFLDIMLGFRFGPNVAEACNSKISIRTFPVEAGKISIESPNEIVDGHEQVVKGVDDPDKTLDTATITKISYQLRYSEDNKRGDRSMRQTAMYHHHDSDAKSLDVFLCLQPTTRPGFDTSLKSFSAPGTLGAKVRGDLCRSPMLLHTLLFATYTPGWTTYSRQKGLECKQQINKALVARISNDKVQNEHAAVLTSFDRVKTLHNLGDQIITSRAHCAGNLQVLERIAATNDDAHFQEALKDAMSKYHGYIQSFSSLHQRISSMTELVGYTLNIHNQLEAGRIGNELNDAAGSLKQMAIKSLRDANTARAVAWISVWYLPTSIAGSLFQANVVNPNSTAAATVRWGNLAAFCVACLPFFFAIGAIMLWFSIPEEKHKFHWKDSRLLMWHALKRTWSGSRAGQGVRLGPTAPLQMQPMPQV